MSTEPKKTLYHGEFREMGPVEVHVKTDVMDSKKKKGEQYCVVVINGFERYIHFENHQCTEFWRNRKDQILTVVAEGHKEEAKFTEVGTRGSRIKAPEQSQERRETKPAAKEKLVVPSESSLPEAKRYVAKNLVLAKIALKAAMKAKAEFEEFHQDQMPNELLVSVYTSLLFGASAAGVALNLPKTISYSTLEPSHHESH